MIPELDRDERLSNSYQYRLRWPFFVTPCMQRAPILVLFTIGFAGLFAGCEKHSPADEHIHVLMKKYHIDPQEIRVKSGERIELEVTTADVQHGLDIPDLGIKEPVQPGRTTIIDFTAPRPGEYRVTCGVLCGPHHDDMVAKLVVY
jgi:heme/copper-type cytochrome/quinol oxidase subunit 2